MQNNQQSLFEPDDEEKSGVYTFDLETQKTFQEVGGRGNHGELKLSAAVLRNEETGEFLTYRESEVNDLIDQLFSAEKVIGYNLLDFDYPVLEPYTPLSFDEINTLDMLVDIERDLNRRVKLDDVAGATIGATKSADGLRAVRWYKEGEVDRVIEYCREDVRITSEVYRYGKEHGHVLVPRHEGTIEVSVDWNGESDE